MYIREYKVTISNSLNGQFIETFTQKSQVLPREIEDSMSKKYPGIHIHIAYTLVGMELM